MTQVSTVTPCLSSGRGRGGAGEREVGRERGGGGEVDRRERERVYVSTQKQSKTIQQITDAAFCFLRSSWSLLLITKLNTRNLF